MSDEHLIHPVTGELVPANAPTASLAEQLDTVRNAEADLRSFKRSVTALLLERMDHARDWTLDAGAWSVAAPKPAPAYDTDQVRATLAALVADGELTEQAAAKAIRERTTWQIDANGMKALLSVEGDVAAALRACQSGIRERRVVVKRAPALQVAAEQEQIEHNRKERT